jgi:hypothetical protein
MTDFDTACQQNRQRIQELPIRDQYRETMLYLGTTYSYDPDLDCFYPQAADEHESLWDRYGWIVVLVTLTGLSIVTA